MLLITIGKNDVVSDL